MKVFALISGGKDSCFNMMHCVKEGHEIVALGNLVPQDNTVDELDSYMFQTVGHEAIDLYSEAMVLPLYRRKIKGYSKVTAKDYHPDPEDEVEDLYELIKGAKSEINFDAVSCGAILSDYQRIRLESICERLHLTSLCYLWRRDQAELLNEMINCGLNSIIIKTAALGLNKTHLGLALKEMQPILLDLTSKYGSHCCGEGGEFETFTLDCPLFKKRIVIDEKEVLVHSDDFFAPVTYLKLKSMHLEEKSDSKFTLDILSDFPLFSSDKWEKQFDKYNNKNTESQEFSLALNKFTNEPINDSNGKRLEVSTECGKFIGISEVYAMVSNDELDDEKAFKQSVRVAFSKLHNLLLTDFSIDLGNILYLHLNISNMDYYGKINSVYKEFWGQNPPSRSCIQCLPEIINDNSTLIFQVDCICCKANNIKEKKSMHVQSLSHWAPANIGPFSQCTQLENLLFLSGIIGLVPGTMKLIAGGYEAQAVASLHHVEKVLKAMNTACELCSIVQCISYVTRKEDLTTGYNIWKKTSGNSNYCNPVFVCVDRLPKDALSEWQIIACIPNYTEEQVVNIYQEEFVSSVGITIQWHMVEVVQTNHNKSAIFTCSVSYTVKINSPAVETLKECFNEVLSSKNYNPKTIIQLRAFYTDDTKFNTLWKSVFHGYNICLTAVRVKSCLGINGQPSSLVCGCLFNETNL